MRTLLLPLVAAMAVSCTPQLPEGRFACTTADDCPASWTCDTSTSRCVSQAGDGGSCGPGRTASGAECVDLDECLTPDVCGAGQASCENLDPGFRCNCLAGYVVSSDARSCENEDECVAGSDDCGWVGTCADTVGSFTCDCPIGFDPAAGGACLATCVVANDPHAGVRTFNAGHGAITGAGGALYGFDLDGINNQARGSGGVGRSIAGCERGDEIGGIDNSLGALSLMLATLTDIGVAYNDAIVNGSLPIAIALDHVAPGGSTNDPCVGVTLTIDGVQHVGVGSLEDHIVNAVFATTVSLGFPIVFPPPACNSDTCNPADLVFPLRGARVRLTLDATNSNVLDATISGFVYFEDPTGDPAFDALDANGFKQNVLAFGTAANLMSSYTEILSSGFAGSRDLHAASDGALARCSAPGGDASMIDRNSFSVAVHLSP